MKIVVVGLGYVGLSNAVILAQHNEVIGVDISQERVDALNARKSQIIDSELSEYLSEKDLNLSASADLEASIIGADYVIVSTPTNYDEKTNFFDTSSVETVIAQVIAEEPDAHDAPSNLASIGRYVLTPDIFDTLRGLKAGSGGEIQLVDALNFHAQQGAVETVRLNGQRFDCGSVDGFMKASNHKYAKKLGV